MATENVSRVLRNPGRFALDPTDLSAAFPHGGTSLGYARAVEVRPGIVTSSIRAEEFGGEIVEEFYQRSDWVIGLILRQWDDDVIEKLFPASAIGTASGQRVIQHPGSVRAGTPIGTSAGLGRTMKVLFAPDDASNPAVLFRQAILLPDSTLTLNMEIDKDLELALIFRALRAASGQAVEIGVLEDLTL